MKRLLAFVLAVCFVFALVSCVEGAVTTENEGGNVEETQGAGSGNSDATTEDVKEPTESVESTEKDTQDEKESGEETVTEEEQVMIYPQNGEVVVLANDDVYAWWNSYNFGKTDSTPFYRHEDIYYPNSVTFSWEADEKADYYRPFISTDENFDAAKTEGYLVNTASLTLSHLYVGTKYYWKVIGTELLNNGEDERNFIVVENAGFATAESPRCLEVGGVSNTRDIGGISMRNGTRIKQGMIYRGGKLEDITEEGKEMMRDYLGIKTDLDLRTPGEGGAGSGSPLGSDINYININGRYYLGSKGIDTEEGKKIFADEIRLFANPDNYPIYIHCSLGRDRTGTIVFVLEALLGVNKNMLIMDYELSVFSVTGTADNASISAIKNNILMVYDYIRGFEGATFAEQTENYLLSIGITAQEIQTIKDLLLEEVE